MTKYAIPACEQDGLHMRGNVVDLVHESDMKIVHIEV